MAVSTPVNTGYTIINGTTTGSNGNKVNTWVEYKVTSQSVANNTSTIRVVLYSQATWDSGTSHEVTKEYGYVNIDSSQQKYSMTDGYDFGNKKLNKFADHTFTVTHGTDGKKTVTIGGAWSDNWSRYISGGSASASVTLPQIARASTISSLSTNLGSAGTISITRQSSDFTHTLTYSFGFASGTIATKTTSTSVSWAPDVSLIDQFGANSSSGTGTITCTTYSGNTPVGTSTSTLTLTIPNSSLWNASGTFGSALTLTATNACSSGLTYTFAYYNGSSWQSIASTTNKTLSWTPNTSLIANVSNASSGTFNIMVITERGATVVNTATASVSLTIPKNTSSDRSGTIGSALSIPITKAHSKLTSTITYSFGNQSNVQIVNKTTSTSYSWTPATSLLTEIPSATSGIGTIKIESFNGDISLGSNTYNLTLAVADSVIPTISFDAPVRVNSNATVESWGIYLQGYSAVKVKLRANGVSGSTISRMSITGQGISSASTPGTSSPSLETTSPIFGAAGTFSYTGAAIDSRNRSASEARSSNVVVQAYSSPSVSNTRIVRCNSDGTENTAGTSLKVTLNSSYTQVGQNAFTAHLEYKSASDTSWTTVTATAIDPTTANVFNLGLNIDQIYYTRIRYSDSLSGYKYTTEITIPSDERIINVNASGKGLAIGGFSTEPGKLQVYYPANFEGNTLPTINNLPFVAEAKGFALYGGTDIPSNSDLNDDTFMDAGTWYCQTNAIANTLTNCPTGYAFRMVVAKTLTSMQKVGSGSNWNGSQQIIYDYMGNVYSRYIYYADTDTDKRTGVWYGGLKDNTTVGNLGWNGYRANGINIPTLNTLAYWNGAYTGTTSNLEYFGSNALNNLTNHGTFSGSNANDCLTLGVWLINPSTTTANLPYSDWGFLRVERQASNYIQTFFRLYGQNTFVRIYANGDWRGWRELGNGVDGGTYNWVTATGSNVTLTGSTANVLCTLTVPHRDVWLVEGYCKVTATASANTKVELYLSNYWSNHRVGAWIPYTNTPLYMQYNHVAWGTDISSAVDFALWHSADVSVSDILLRFYKIQSTALT